MLCFAANSLLCRLALASHRIDPATFTTARVFSAAAMLGGIVWMREHRLPRLAFAKAASVTALLAYLAFFSFAYTRLSAGTGALILFAAVQITMIGVALFEGERFSPVQWAGLAIAIGGLLYLVLPGVSAPDPLGAVAMAISGMAWGWFSLLARGVGEPVEANAANFLCCLPLVAAVNLVAAGAVHAEPAGLALAAGSGAIASGLGYAIWYLALRRLSAAQAATVQLSVPAIAAFGGAVLLAEPITLRLLFASIAMLGGIAIVLTRRAAKRRM